MPGDKSISHRALVLGALANGASSVAGLNPGDDVAATADALRALGAHIDIDDGDTEARLESEGWAGLREPDDVINARNSGTTLRTLAGVCAAVPGMIVLTGDATLRRRPMLRVVAPLRQMGATIDGARHGDRPPLYIRGGDLVGVDLDLPVASAQVKTCALLAGLRASGTTSVREPGPSRDHTERMLAAAGVRLERTAGAVEVTGGQDVGARAWRVPGDVSAAMFFVVAGCLVPGSNLTIEDVGLNPTRTGLIEVLRRMGADVETNVVDEWGGEPVGSIVVRHSELHGAAIGGAEVATLIDDIPILAVAATQANGETVVSGAAELRVKESDRIAAMVEGLTDVGADSRALDDGFAIAGPTPLRGGSVDARGDHRVAMSFAIAGLVSSANVKVEGWSCVETSFPDFLDVLGRAQGRIA